ncbi:MAG: 1-acyl-sn-glycerol-3-phosphate acyltransferase [Bacteroidales bacterium]|nr:1-acyl-sn-glycerol-3-phosphate acyltransferase [Bacteroidales bacterium]
MSKLLCVGEILELEKKLSDLSNYELADALIDHTGMNYKCENLNKVPVKGRLLVVANHPLGGADWLLIVQCLSNIRKDIKVAINKDVNTLIVNMRDLFIPVDSYATFNEVAIKHIGESLQREEAVIIFPSGGISIMTTRGVRDRTWKNGVVHFSREHQTDILPVYIGGRFKLAFYLYPRRLRRMLLIRNLLHPPSKKVKIVIGDRVPYKELLKWGKLSDIAARLRSITYQLGSL